jgi:hypothetical protein
MRPFKHIAAEVQERGRVARFTFISYAHWQGVEKLGSIVAFDFKLFNTLRENCLLTYNISPKRGDR